MLYDHRQTSVNYGKDKTKCKNKENRLLIYFDDDIVEVKRIVNFHFYTFDSYLPNLSYGRLW